MKKAQVALESVILVFIASALLLLGVLIVIQQNTVSQAVIQAKDSIVECNKIADAISQVYASKNFSERTIFISKTVQITRTGNSPGQIKVGTGPCNEYPVGETYCNYFGTIKKAREGLLGVGDTTGFLLVGNYDINFDMDGNVTFKPVCGDSYCDANEVCAQDNSYCNVACHRVCWVGACYDNAPAGGCKYIPISNKNQDEEYCDDTHRYGDCPEGKQCMCNGSGVCVEKSGR
jgi:hypothetical protein